MASQLVQLEPRAGAATLILVAALIGLNGLLVFDTLLSGGEHVQHIMGEIRRVVQAPYR